jgi:hypothetical protein
MPSVTVTTEPTLRASVAAVKFWIRALISSLISEALMDISHSSAGRDRARGESPN